MKKGILTLVILILTLSILFLIYIVTNKPSENERIKELEKINRDLENLSSQKGAVFLRGSNLNNRI